MSGDAAVMRTRHRHAIEQAARRWRGGRRDCKNLISTQLKTRAKRSSRAFAASFSLICAASSQVSSSEVARYRPQPHTQTPAVARAVRRVVSSGCIVSGVAAGILIGDLGGSSTAMRIGWRRGLREAVCCSASAVLRTPKAVKTIEPLMIKCFAAPAVKSNEHLRRDRRYYHLTFGQS